MSFIEAYPVLYKTLCEVVPKSIHFYFVGGAVRDLLLNSQISDFDFVSEGLVRPIGKKLADKLNGKYYVLDHKREVVRIIVPAEDGSSYNIDIALLSGNTIENDLSQRDFTINAISIDLKNVDSLVDPLGGALHLREKKLVMCSPESLRNDPLRAVRAIRLSLEFSLQFDTALISAMKEIHEYLSQCAMERYRDELCKIVVLEKNVAALLLFEKFDLLSFLFDGCKKKIKVEDFGCVRSIDQVLNILTHPFVEGKAENQFFGLAVSVLGRFRDILISFFDYQVTVTHDRRVLTCLSMILFRLFETNISSSVSTCAKRLVFSLDEIAFIVDTGKAAEDINLLLTGPIIDIKIHYFFQKYAENGISGIMFFLAEILSENSSKEKYVRWESALKCSSLLLDAWFFHYNEIISPKIFLSGNDICEILSISPGPTVGRIKKALAEAQIMKKVTSFDTAIAFIQDIR